MIKTRLLAIVIFAVCTTRGIGQESKTPASDRADAVKSMLRSYGESFNKKDLAAVSGFWTKDCSYLDRGTGERVEGREALKADMKKVFDSEPEMRLSASLDRLKFITDNVAKVEGQTLVTSPSADPLAALFTAVLVKDGENWRISSLEESAVPEPATPRDALKKLEWLIGRWVDEGESSRVETSVRWAANGAFLLRSFTRQTEDGASQLGTQVIGWDPRAKQIRSWVFNADGSFGEGRWSKNGDDWLVKSAQTLADGTAAAGTYVISKVDEETIQIQLIGHTIDGEPQPATDAVKMIRGNEAATEAVGEATAEPAEKN